MHPAELQRHRETRTRLHLLKTFHLIGCKSFALSTLSLILLLKLKHHFPSARFPFHAGQGMGAAGLCISVIAPVKSVPEPIIRATHARHAPSRAQISYCLKIECAVTAPSLPTPPPPMPMPRCFHTSLPPRRVRPRPSDRFLSFTLRALRSAAKNFAGRPRLNPHAAPRDAGPRHRDDGGNDGGGGDGGRRQSRSGMPDGRTHFRSEEVEGA